jgi:hypothetical protein
MPSAVTPRFPPPWSAEVVGRCNPLLGWCYRSVRIVRLLLTAQAAVTTFQKRSGEQAAAHLFVLRTVAR